MPLPIPAPFAMTPIPASILLLQVPAPSQVGPRIVDAAREMVANALGTGDFWVKFILTLLLLVALWATRRVVLRVVEPRVDDPRTRYQWTKVTSYIVSTVGLLTVGAVWLSGLRSIGTFLGLLSAGLAIALKDVVADLAAWLFIVFRRPFEVGDRIQIGPNAGDVVDLTLFQFTILEIGNWVEADQSTGRIIHVPNALVFTQPLANYTAEFQYIWNEIGITVTFESDWRRAAEVLREVAARGAGGHAAEAEAQLRRATRKFFIRYSHLTPVVYTEIRPNGVLLTLRYLCPARARRGTAAELNEMILEAFGGEAAVQIAYPTSRLFRNNEEGKPALRPEGFEPPPGQDPRSGGGEEEDGHGL
jgi:small-conductance mechanosensitive channel